MAESQDDKKVDTAVARMQALLDELKAAQRQDVTDESGEEDAEYKGGRNLQDAENEAYVRVRAHTRARRTQSQAPGA